MKFAFFDASAGLSGDMILAALLDLGAPRPEFRKAMASLGLSVRLSIRDVERSHLRGLKVDVKVIKPNPHARRWRDIERFIRRCPFDAPVKARALDVFRNLFLAEAKVHGRPFEDVHLHEAGADDALVDILGTCWLLQKLQIEKVSCSPLNVGSGWVKTAHGVLPVPPPAVAELLRGFPVYAAHAQAELVTPTGAALIKTLAEEGVPLPELTYDRIGYGAGGRDIPGLPNILRVFAGPLRLFKPAKRVFLIEAAIDDATPQILAAFMDRAHELGALEAHLTPIVMKKNRLGTKLTLLAEGQTLDRLITAVFEETTSIGVRFFPVERRVLERSVRTVRLGTGAVRVKVASLGGRTLNVQPEYDDALALARKKGIPLKEILRRAAEAFDRMK